MKKEDYDFQKNCQLWHIKIGQCIKNGQFDKVEELQIKVRESLGEWEEQVKTARLRTQMLKALLTITATEKRIKLGRDKRNK